MQVRGVLDERRRRHLCSVRRGRSGNLIDRVVGGGRDIEYIVRRIVGESGWSEFQRGRVGPMAETVCQHERGGAE